MSRYKGLTLISKSAITSLLLTFPVLFTYSVICPVLKTYLPTSNNSHAVLGITLGKVINVLFFLRNPGFPSSTTDLTTCNYNVQKAIEGTFFKYFLSSFSPNYSAIFVDFLKKLHTR